MQTPVRRVYAEHFILRELLLTFVVVVFGSVTCPVAIAQDSQEIGSPLAAVRGFVDAFNALYMPEVIAYFADDATLFYPPFSGPEPFPLRVEGRQEIQRSFQLVFEMFRRNSGRSEPPYINIRPEETSVQAFDGFAVGSFHLGNESNRQRRTLVLHNIGSP